ncbi:hypothetical protein DM02DRAFT_631824 [Periconia macrospinosa]|uniref:Uncharacterized protein n=1 Tax=Periconia macrospinosa TaxID=97972 RepID=A0A2V1DET2_9PLEO|nr:hypothetical protein DM02DRAFT_631824 [Periconia macrospinosa]
MSTSPTGPTPQTARKKRSAPIDDEDFVPEQELEQPAAKTKKTATGEKQVTAAAPRAKKQPAPKPKLGKLAKLYKAHKQIPKMIPTKVNLKDRNAVGVQKVSIGASFNSNPDPYKRRNILEDAKKVDADLELEAAQSRAKPKPEVEIRVDENDPDVEIILCPGVVRWVRITNKMHNDGGERALLSEIRKRPDHYPHIKVEDSKDDQGRTVIRRRKVDPETLEELRKAEQKRNHQEARAATRARKAQKNDAAREEHEQIKKAAADQE